MPFDYSREAHAAWLGTGHVDVTLGRELDDRDLLHAPTEAIEGGSFRAADLTLLAFDESSSRGPRIGPRCPAESK